MSPRTNNLWLAAIIFTFNALCDNRNNNIFENLEILSLTYLSSTFAFVNEANNLDSREILILGVELVIFHNFWIQARHFLTPWIF